MSKPPDGSDGAPENDSPRGEVESVDIEEILEAEHVPPDAARRIRQVVEVLYEERTSGPFPPPTMLAGYERVLPGAADRIFRIAEEEAASDRANRAELVRQRGRGQVFGFVLALTALIIAAVLIAIDKPLGGLVIIAVEAIGVAIALITGAIGPRSSSRPDQALEQPNGEPEQPPESE